MSAEIKVNAEPRTCSGSTAARRLRRSGIIPGVLNISSGESTLIQFNAHDFERIISQHVGSQIIVSLEVGDKKNIRNHARDSASRNHRAYHTRRFQ